MHHRKKVSGVNPVDERASQYLQQLGQQKYDVNFMQGLRVLRDRCSHMADNYITPNDMRGLDQLQVMLPELEAIVKTLLKNPPSDI